MIRVIRIAGESFDLESGKEMSKAIVLSNGHRELSVYVDDDIIQGLLQMSAEAVSEAPQIPQHPGWPKSLPSDNGTGAEQPLSTVMDQGGLADALATQGTELDFETDPVFEATPSFGPKEPEFEAGEEYDDPSTGTPSL